MAIHNAEGTYRISATCEQLISAESQLVVTCANDSLDHTWRMTRLVPPVLAAGTMSSRTQPVLRVDDRLALRPWNQADVPAIVAAYADPDIQRWNLNTYGADEAKTLVTKWNRSWMNETSAHWAITETFDDLAIGRVGLRTLDLTAVEGEMSYWVAPTARGFGIATLATSALSEWLLHSLGLHRLEIGHSIRNPASCRVATKAGYVGEYTTRSALLHADGWHDMHWHARIRSDAA